MGSAGFGHQHFAADGIEPCAAHVQGQGGVHVLGMVAEPGTQFCGHVANGAQIALCSFGRAFAHDGQHHFVLLAVAVAGGKACGLHPAVFLVKVVLGMRDQLVPKMA